MDESQTISRRQFLKVAGGGFGLGGAVALGMSLQPIARTPDAQDRRREGRAQHLPLLRGRLRQIVSVRDGTDRQHRGQPRQPDQPRHALPQGRGHLPARRQPEPQHQGDVSQARRHRMGASRPRLGHGPDRRAGEEDPRRDLHETWTVKDADGKDVQKKVNHTLAIASLGGATMDNEWNYVQRKLCAALGLIWLENQARI